MPWTYTQRSLENVIEIDAPPDRVMGLLTHPENFARVHPGIVRVREVDSASEYMEEENTMKLSLEAQKAGSDRSNIAANYLGTEMKRYMVTESLYLPFLRCFGWRYSYRYTLLQTEETRVMSASFWNFGIRITAVYSLGERNDLVVLREELTVRAPKGTRWFVFPHVFNSNLGLLNKIKTVAEEEEQTEIGA